MAGRGSFYDQDDDLDRAEVLRRAVADLPAGQRRAVTMYYYADLPAGQIAGSAGDSRSCFPQGVDRLTARSSQVGRKREGPSVQGRAHASARRGCIQTTPIFFFVFFVFFCSRMIFYPMTTSLEREQKATKATKSRSQHLCGHLRR